MNLDAVVLKGLTSNVLHARDFAARHGSDLFVPEFRLFASRVIRYVDLYRSVPTANTLVGSVPPAEASAVQTMWDVVDSCTGYVPDEHTFQVKCLRDRFQTWGRDHLVGVLAGEGNTREVLKDVATTLQRLRSSEEGRTHLQRTVRDHTPHFLEHLERIKNPEVQSRILTGYSMFDQATRGIAPGELLIVGGETGHGKSTFLQNLAIQMWQGGAAPGQIGPGQIGPGHDVLYFSLEMPYEECYTRLISRLAQVDQSSFDLGVSPPEMVEVQKGLDFIASHPREFQIVDVPRGTSIEEIDLRFHEALLQFNPEVVVVDYMTIMQSADGNEQDWLRLGQISASLHQFARTYKVSLLTAVQLTDIKRNNSGKTAPKEEQSVGLHRIGRSSQIMHHANFGVQIVTRPGEERYPDFKYKIIKNRRGPLAEGSLTKDFARASLLEPEDADPSVGLDGEDLVDRLRRLQAEDEARP